MGGRGATPGKRMMGLRVVARDGARLTGGAVIARNAMREIEVFLPLSFLGYQTAQGSADGFLVMFALLWSGIFLFFPLFNRDRLRIGDLVAGTWVVRAVRGKLGHDLGVAERPRRMFPATALDLYGVYELQTLEDVLRGGREEAISTVAWTIRRQGGTCRRRRRPRLSRRLLRRSVRETGARNAARTPAGGQARERLRSSAAAPLGGQAAAPVLRLDERRRVVDVDPVEIAAVDDQRARPVAASEADALGERR